MKSVTSMGEASEEEMNQMLGRTWHDSGSADTA